MTERALKLALEALENLFGIPDKWTGEGGGDVAVWRLGGSYRAQQAITAIKEALAQPEQEPVAKIVSTAPERIWLDLGFDPTEEDDISFHDLVDATWSEDNATGYGIEYVRAETTPPQRKPLTDEELFKLWDEDVSCDMPDTFTQFKHTARAIEQAHGIKE